MTVPVHTAAGRGGSTRLPWWALLLPAVAFVLLLALIAGGDGASAAEGGRAAGQSVQEVPAAVPLVLEELWARAESALLG